MYREYTEMDIASLYPAWEMVQMSKKQKENSMKRDFIVVHLDRCNSHNKDIAEPALIFIDSISGISDGEITCNFGRYYVEESLADITRMLKDKGAI